MGDKQLQKRLIVNADDFGLDSAINHGIAEAFRNGIVTNTSLLTCGMAFDEAVEIARVNKALGVGVHLSLNEERPVLSCDKIRTLLNKERDSFLDQSTFLIRLACGEINLGQIYIELEAQIEKFLKTGLRPTHIDSHKHIHLIPKILDICLKLAKKFGISNIRISRTPLSSIVRSKRWVRALGIFGLSALTNVQLEKIRARAANSSDYCYGLLESGTLNECVLTNILNCLPIGTSELICHPGFATNDLLARYKWKYHWLAELEALTNPTVRSIINALNIQLIRHDEI